VAAADPNNFRAASTVATSVNRIGIVLREMGQLSASAAEQQRAIALYAALAKRPGAEWHVFADQVQAHTDLADTYIAMAGRKSADPAERRQNWYLAAAEYDQARAIFAEQRKKRALSPDQIKRLDEVTKEAERCRAEPDR
jgi:hypothetical protein